MSKPLEIWKITLNQKFKRQKQKYKKKKDSSSNQWNKMIKISKIISEIKTKLQDSQGKIDSNENLINGME